MRKKADISFSGYYDEKTLRKDISNASLSLMIPGLVLAAVFTLKAIVSVGFWEKFSIAIALLGLLAVLLGVVIPRRMIPVTKKLSGFFNRVGVVLIKVLLIPVYCITFLTSFWYAKIKRRDYRFASWEDRRPVQTSFFATESESLVSRKRGFTVIGSILSGISAHKMYILLPLIFVLLVVGLLFFFVSSSTVFSFIYTFV